jgi:hypothetical protein
MLIIAQSVQYQPALSPIDAWTPFRNKRKKPGSTNFQKSFAVLDPRKRGLPVA